MAMLRSLLLLSICCGSVLAADGEPRTLVDFSGKNTGERWKAINDGVMGGRSEGQFDVTSEGHLQFFGNLSLENNGGFASVRMAGNNLGLAPTDVVVLRVRGDGRTYKFNLYTHQKLSGYAFRQSFPTKANEWIEVELPVKDFTATWHGRTFPNIALNPAQVSGLGLLLGDKKPGPFKLEVDWIRARPAKSKS